MKITKVTADHYRVPVHREMHDALREFSVLDLVLAHVETDEGVSGLGFTYNVMPYGGREICSLINGAIDPLIRGLDPRDHERVWYQMWRQMDWVGRGGIVVLAVAAVDIALWDWKSKVAGLPLHKLLGGARERVPIYNTDGGWLNHTPEQLVDETNKIIAAGFLGTKIKVGKDDPMEDRERIAAVRQVLGPKRTLMVDANERFTHAEAIKRVPHVGGV